jgi:hypothetical protein
LVTRDAQGRPKKGGGREETILQTLYHPRHGFLIGYELAYTSKKIIALGKA